jgi:carotenoid cleavage dioxygenase
MTITDAAASSTPWFLQGNYAPVTEEVTATDLEITGAIPPELNGRFLRNGPNPKSGTSGHWFMGDGMLHGIELQDGRANWYRNRWVRTRAFNEGASFVGPDGTVDRTVGVANTHVICHAGRIFALVESSFPTEVTRDLDTVGPYDYEGKLTSAMTAHPKLCPTTGELHFFGYHFFEPYLVYNRADASGQLVQSEVIDVAGPTMIHDFNLTANHVVFMDLPIVFDFELALQGTMPYKWDDDYGARLGVMPRGGKSSDVIWYDIDPCYVFHPLNAFEEDDGRIVIDAARYPELWRGTSLGFNAATMHRFTIDPVAGKVIEQGLDDRNVEFPRVDDRRVGLPNRFGWATQTFGTSDLMSGGSTVKYDLKTGATTAHDFGAGRVPGEGVFVAASADAAEDEGWVLTYVYDAARDASDFVILDGRDPAAPAVATIALPQRIPFGFHGSWIPASALGAGE